MHRAKFATLIFNNKLIPIARFIQDFYANYLINRHDMVIFPHFLNFVIFAQKNSSADGAVFSIIIIK